MSWYGLRGVLAPAFDQCLMRFRRRCAVGIDEVDDLDVLHAAELVDVAPPRPLSPATATRMVSLAPRTLPDDLVPAMVTVAAVGERPLQERAAGQFETSIGSSHRWGEQRVGMLSAE